MKWAIGFLVVAVLCLGVTVGWLAMNQAEDVTWVTPESTPTACSPMEVERLHTACAHHGVGCIEWAECAR